MQALFYFIGNFSIPPLMIGAKKVLIYCFEQYISTLYLNSFAECKPIRLDYSTKSRYLQHKFKYFFIII